LASPLLRELRWRRLPFVGTLAELPVRTAKAAISKNDERALKLLTPRSKSAIRVGFKPHELHRLGPKPFVGERADDRTANPSAQSCQAGRAFLKQIEQGALPRFPGRVRHRPTLRDPRLNSSI
jgi:hypothetical protein